MNVSASFIGYFMGASFIVQCVMLLLLLASCWSWVLIFQRGFFLRQQLKDIQRFEKEFWATTDLTSLYQSLTKKDEPTGLERVFISGFREFARLRKRTHLPFEEMIAGTKRAMDTTQARLMDELEEHLPFLATVGSVTPYVGLFGTVWGIMNAFRSLGNVTQATIAMVAPGISEALIATAMGLFAAIPAVIAYNKYVYNVDRITMRYEVFQEEFAGYLFRSVQVSE